jgi:hypothetical protein
MYRIFQYSNINLKYNYIIEQYYIYYTDYYNLNKYKLNNIRNLYELIAKFNSNNNEIIRSHITLIYSKKYNILSDENLYMRFLWIKCILFFLQKK